MRTTGWTRRCPLLINLWVLYQFDMNMTPCWLGCSQLDSSPSSYKVFACFFRCLVSFAKVRNTKEQHKAISHSALNRTLFSFTFSTLRQYKIKNNWTSSFQLELSWRHHSKKRCCIFNTQVSPSVLLRSLHSHSPFHSLRAHRYSTSGVYYQSFAQL